MINISPDLQLEDNQLIGQGVAVLGTPGSGKSNFVRVFVEETGDRLPMTIFDPHREFYTLNEKFQFLRVGKGGGVDLEVTAEQVAEIAEYSFNNNASVIVDMIEMDEDEQIEFVYNYCAKLWSLNLLRKKPYGLVIEEAQIFIPQNGKQTAALKMMKKIASQGRKFGFTIILSTQRVSEINKSVLNGCKAMFFFNVFLPADVKVYQDFLPFEPAETKKLAPNLEPGQAIYRHGKETKMFLTRWSTTTRVGDTPELDPSSFVLRQPDRGMIEALQKQIVVAAEPSAPVADVHTVTTSEFEALKQQNTELQATISKLQKQLQDAIAEAVKQKNLLKAEAAKPKTVRKTWSIPGIEIEGKVEDNGQFKITRQTTHIETIEGSHQSTRQIAIKVKRQESAFDVLLTEVRNLRPDCSAILLEALTRKGGFVKLIDVAMEYDYALSTVKRGLPDLLRTGLVTRTDSGDIQSTADAYLLSSFPALDAKTLRKRLNETVENRLERG